MDTPSSTLPRPRLRLFRRSPSPLDHTAHNGDDEFPTPRVHPRPMPDTTPHAPPAETPAARLRALLAREPRSPRSSTPPPFSDADSAAEPPRLGSSTSSVARDSLKDIFSRALREPGDTPQKGRPRRNSFDGSSMEITPVVRADRGQRRRAARRSLSDEEAESSKPDRRPDPSFRLSTALTFDALRARLASSRSQLVDQIPPEAVYDHSSLASTSTSDLQRRPEPSTSTRVNPQVGALTPHPSFQISSQLAFQSNLLEQDSEMQRVIGDVLNSENEASTSAPNVAQPTTARSDSRPPSSLRDRRASHQFDSLTTSSPVNGATDTDAEQQGERSHHREREQNLPRLPSRSNTPEMHRRHSQEFHRRLSQGFRPPSHAKSISHESVVSQSGVTKPVHRHLERRGSLASLRSLDDDHSSRPSSIGSQADYRDRISELDRERNYEREREWNKRHPPSRPSSSLSTSSDHSFSHSHSHPPRSPSATPYRTPTHASLQRKASRTSLRSDSPTSVASSRDSLNEREPEVKKEITHERERNWNSPRPHWSASKSPSSHLRIRNKDNNSLRASSSLIRLGDSDGHANVSRASAKLQSASPKVDSSSATSPVVLHESGDRSDLGLEESAIGTVPSEDPSPGKAPGAASKFGWNFARSPLPPPELDNADRRRHTSSPTSGSRLSDAIISGQIPVRSRMKSFSGIGHVASDMSLTHVVGDESSVQQDYQNRQSELVESHNRGGPPATRNSRNQEDIILGSDEESVVDLPPQSTTPKSNPPNSLPEEIDTNTDTEVLTSPPQGSPQLGVSASIANDTFRQKVDDPSHAQTHNPRPEEPPIPPGTPASASSGPQSPTSPFALATPPRQRSFGSSILDFQTPSPPHDLPDLPGPPSSSDDEALGDTPMKDRRVDTNSNFTLTKTPKPPGAWAATPLLSKFGHRSASPTFFPLDSTPPASTSTPLPRATSLPPTRTNNATDNSGEDELLTPVGTLSRARSLPLRTPAPPGAWVATPGQSALLSNDQSQYGSLGRRKGLLKVRFDVTESETSATEGRSNSPLSAIRLVNPELPLPKPTTDHRIDSDAEAVMNEVPQLTPTSALPHRPATPERPTTPVSRENGPSPRSLRKSPSVRLVDAYGRERVDEEGAEKPLTGIQNGHADRERKTTSSPPTPRRGLVRIVDAMGKEVDDIVGIPDASTDRANRSFEADVSVVSDDTPIGHAEALVRMRKTLRDLAETLSDTDRSEDLELNSSHLEQLEEVSKAARLVRNQLAHNLRMETEKQYDLHHDSKPSALLPLSTRKTWSTTIIYCGVIIQLLFVLVMWRYAHAEAGRLFYTTYYDPLYPELTSIRESSCFSGTLSTSRSWTMLDSYETIRREGWRSIQKEILRAMKYIGEQAWEQWGENVHFEKPT